MGKISRLDYCQHLLSTQVNYTITNFANHTEKIGHDSINRYLGREKLTPRLVWELVKTDVVPSPNGFILFIGIVNCIYLNPETEQYWIIDYCIFDPDRDGKTKLDHVAEMLRNIVLSEQLNFRTVLMDSWYATKEMMLMIESMNKLCYCPLKTNRLVDDSGGTEKYKPVKKLSWSSFELENGKRIKINKFPKDHKVQLFPVPVSTNRTDYIVTNDVACSSSSDAREVCAKRWKIEQFHRELKQTTGIEKCQCRKARIQKGTVENQVFLRNFHNS